MRPLNLGLVNRRMQLLGGTDELGRPTLEGVLVGISDQPA
jgi:hypothetical protein